MTVHANSIAQYKENVLPSIMGRKLEVYQAIKHLGGEATIYEIGQLLNKSLNTFSGRISELKRMGFIVDTGRVKKHNTNRFFTIWKTA